MSGRTPPAPKDTKPPSPKPPPPSPSIARLLLTAPPPQVLSDAGVSREEFVPRVDALGIDSSFSPRLITAEAILKFVHTEALLQIHFMRSGFEALELAGEPSSPLVRRGMRPAFYRYST